MSARKNPTFNADVFRRLWANPKVKTERIADAMGISRQAVSQRAKAMQLASRAHLRLIKHDPALLAQMWAAGVPTDEIASYFGMADGASASRAALNAGLPHRQRGAAGCRNGGWVKGQSLAEFLEAQAAERFQEAVLSEQRALAAAQRAVDQSERAA